MIHINSSPIPSGNLGASDPEIRELQAAINTMADKLGSPFSKVVVDGEMTGNNGADTFRNLWKLWDDPRFEEAIAQLGGLGGLAGKISNVIGIVIDVASFVGNIPGIGNVLDALTGKTAMRLLWTIGADEVSQIRDVKNEIIGFLKSHGDKVARAIGVFTLLAGGDEDASNGAGTVPAFKLEPGGMTAKPPPKKYPPGTIAVRDPAINKYRILVPIV